MLLNGGRMTSIVTLLRTAKTRNKCSQNKDHIILAGDMNAIIKKEPIPQLIGVGLYGENSLNQDGRKLGEFVTFNELKKTNTFFR